MEVGQAARKQANNMGSRMVVAHKKLSICLLWVENTIIIKTNAILADFEAS